MEWCEEVWAVTVTDLTTVNMHFVHHNCTFISRQKKASRKNSVNSSFIICMLYQTVMASFKKKVRLAGYVTRIAGMKFIKF
jgi:hypothetical protein